jgi:hypothetical protein
LTFVVALADQDDAQRVLKVVIVLGRAQLDAVAAQREPDLGEVVGADPVAAREPVEVLHPQVAGTVLGGQPDRVVFGV